MWPNKWVWSESWTEKPGHTVLPAWLRTAHGQKQSDCQSLHPAVAAHLNFDDALPRPTASVPLALPYPSDWRPASTSLSPRVFWGVREITDISLDRIIRTVRTSSHQLRVNGLRDIKEPELPRLSRQAKPIHAIKSVIIYTVIFKSPEAGGLVSPLNCNTSPAVAVQWVWVVFTSLRWSSAWWFLSTEDNSASAMENKTSPSFLALSSVAWMCRRPDNSRTPATQRREHFQGIWPNPSDISPIKKKKKKIRANSLFPFRV